MLQCYGFRQNYQRLDEGQFHYYNGFDKNPGKVNDVYW